MGSLANLHLGEGDFENARETLAAVLAAGAVGGAVHLGTLRHGVAGASRLMFCVSTAMGEAEIDRAGEALEASLLELRPMIEEEAPALLA